MKLQPPLPVCDMANAAMFDDMKSLREFYDELPAVSVDRVGVCHFCACWHAETHLRGPAGATSGTQRENIPLPPGVEAHNRAMSARDTERFKAL